MKSLPRPKIQNAFRLRAGAAITLLAALVSTVAAQTPREPDQGAQRHAMTPMQAEMTLFILRDLEYTLLSAPPPEADGQTLGLWLAGVKQKLDVLENLAASLTLDNRVDNSVEAVRDLALRYEIFLSGLNIIDYSTTAILTKGDGSKLLSVATVALGIASESASSDPTAFVVGAVCNTASYVLQRWDASIQHNSLIEKIHAQKANVIEQQVQRAKNAYIDCLSSLKLSSQSLAADYRIKTPNFAPDHDHIETDDSNPFSLASRSFALSRSKPGQAAELLTKAAAAIPAYTGENSEFLSQAYRAPYLLMAAHLYEHGSRLQPELAAALAGKSTDLYSRAAGVLGKESDAIPVCYLISRARALTSAGQTTKAKALIAEIKTNLATESRSTLSRGHLLYDLACLSSRLGDLDEAMDLLRESFKAKPRRDPRILSDPNLSKLLARRQAEVEMLAKNPLTGVRWQTEGGQAIEFFDGGIFLSGVDGTLYAGKWEITGDDLTLSGRHAVHGSGQLPADAALTFQVKDGVLHLSSGGTTSTFTGEPWSFVGSTEVAPRLLTDAGSWWSSGLSSNTNTRYYFVCPNFDDGWLQRKWEVCFIEEDPLKGATCVVSHVVKK